MADSEIIAVLNRRDDLLQKQQELYVEAITNINMRYRQLLTNDFGATLANNCVRDMAGEFVRNYFDTSNFYITADQLAYRILHFSYEDSTNPMEGDEGARKAIYNMTDSPAFSSFLKEINQQNQQAQKILFEKERVTAKSGNTRLQYKDRDLMTDAKESYRANQPDATDELSGARSDRLEVDHIQAAATATYNSRYLNDPAVIDELKQFYNSPDNFQMLSKSANASKGDVRVYSDGNRTYSSTELTAIKKELTNTLRSKYQRAGQDSETALKQARQDAEKEISSKYSDVTYAAGAKTMADAVCKRWENANSKAKENLKKDGHLGEDGKVPPAVRKRLEAELRHSMNQNSMAILKNTDYKAVAKDAAENTKKGFSKIIIGQVVYYVVPPVVFETQQLVRKKGMTLDRFLKELKHAGKRIIQYAKSKLKEIFKNVVFNSLQLFVKSFFDILISLVKETVRRLLRVAKSLVLALVQSVRVLCDPKASGAEKADAVTKILAATITNVVVVILFEMLENTLSIDSNGFMGSLLDVLRIIVSVIATNLIMLILQKADLFDVQYGLLVANIEQVFAEERQQYLDTSARLTEEVRAEMSYYMDELNNRMENLEKSIQALDLYKNEVLPGLEEINDLFAIGIDFQAEWRDFCRCG